MQTDTRAHIQILNCLLLLFAVFLLDDFNSLFGFVFMNDSKFSKNRACVFIYDDVLAFIKKNVEIIKNKYLYQGFRVQGLDIFGHFLSGWNVGTLESVLSKSYFQNSLITSSNFWANLNI